MRRQPAERLSPWSILGAVLAIVGIARLAAVVLHEPMLAFANQYDMVRTSACVGLYPDLPGEQRFAASPAAPLERYRLGSPVPEACYPGTESAIAAIVTAKHRLLGDPAASFPALREVGILKLAIAILSIGALAMALRASPVASLVHGATVLVVMSDPAVSLWFQTLYAEFPVIFGLYLAVGALVAAALRASLSPGLAALAGAGIVLVAFAKEQFYLLPIALVAVSAPLFWSASRLRTLALVAVAALAVPWHATISRPESIAPANRANAYLGLVLPASADLGATLSRLGLPERCAAMSGATWYLPRGEDLKLACPEALRLPSTAFLRLMPSEPGTLARAAARVLPATQEPLPAYLGMVAGARWAPVGTQSPWLDSLLSPAAMALPVAWYLGMGILAFLLAVPALVAWIGALATRDGTGAGAFAAYVLMLSLTAAYSLGTTAFGDGLSESARHNLPGFLAMAALAVAIAFAPWGIRRLDPAVRTAVAIALVLALAGSAAATAWVLRQPIAIGVVDTPYTKEVPREGFVLRGWALDPLGVKAVRIRVGDRGATIGRGAFLPSADLARLFGGYPGATAGRFELAVPGAWLQQPELRLEVKVVSEAGVETEIDRRRIRPTP